MASNKPSLDTSSRGGASQARSDTPIWSKASPATADMFTPAIATVVETETEDEHQGRPTLPFEYRGAAAGLLAKALGPLPNDSDEEKGRGRSGAGRRPSVPARPTRSRPRAPAVRGSSPGSTDRRSAADRTVPPEVLDEIDRQAAEADEIEPAKMIHDHDGVPDRFARSAWPNPAVRLQPAATGWARDKEAGKFRQIKQVRASDDLRGTRAGRWWGTGIGAVVGAAVAGVALGVATGGIGLVVGGAIVGALVGAFGGYGLGDVLSGLRSGHRPQKAHLDAALRRLDAADVRFTTAQEDNLAKVTDQQWRTLLPVPHAQVPDRLARQKARTTLVLNVARHGFDDTLQAKLIAIGAARSGVLGESATDLDSLKACFRGPEDLWLYGPSAKDMADGVRKRLRELPTKSVDENSGLSTVLLRDLGRQLRPVLTDRNGDEIALGERREDQDLDAQKAARELGAFVGDQRGDQAAVARNLSHYLNQDPVNEIVIRASNLVSNKGDPARMEVPDMDAKDVSGDPAMLVQDTPNNQWEIAVREADDRESYVVSYWCSAPIKNLQILGVEEVGEGLPMDRAKSFLTASMSIRLQRRDLAKGNGRFTYVDPPHSDVRMLPGAPSAELPLLHARPSVLDTLPARRSITHPGLGDQNVSGHDTRAHPSVDATNARFTPVSQHRPMLFPTASSNQPLRLNEAPQSQQGPPEQAQTAQQHDDAIQDSKNDESHHDD